MGRQLAIMQSPQDVADLWAAIPDKLSVAAIPRQMESRPECAWRPEGLAGDRLLLFSATDWEGIRAAIAPGTTGLHRLIGRVGVVEWSPTEVREGNQYVVGARIYIQEDADVPSSAGSAKIFNWMSRWMKQHYRLVPSEGRPIAIGPHLLADIEAGKATAIYPSGKPLISPTATLK